jgi:hypothetical protein
MQKQYKASQPTNPSQLGFFPGDEETNFIFAWEDTEIYALQKAMLKQALQELRDLRKSKQMRQEAWNWIMSDEEHAFSSRTCASNNGYNIEQLRGYLRRLVTDL